MSLRIEWRIYSNSGDPIAPASVTLSNPGATFGVRRLDTLDSVVAVGTPLVDGGGGIWYYEFEEPEPRLEYEYYLRVQEPAPINNVYYINGKVKGSTGYNPHTLGWCRKKLIDVTQRFDLVEDAIAGDYTDLGLANWYINAGQHRLDNLLEYHKSTAWLYKTVPAGETLITFTQARHVKNVYQQNVDTGSRCMISWMTEFVGLAPDQQDLQSGDLPDAENIVFGNHYWTHGIRVNPQESGSRLIAVEGEWFSRHLLNDYDRSFWTCQYPQLLVRAAQREMEVDHRNSQGVNDFDAAILPELANVQKNLIAEETAGPPQLWRMM